MSHPGDQAATTSVPAAPTFKFSQLLPTLVFDALLPVVIFNLLTHYKVAAIWALAAGGASPALNNLRVWIRSRRLEPVGMLVLGFLVIGTLASLLSGSVVFALVKDSFLTGVFGLILLGSMFARRPLFFYLARQFVAGDDPERIAWWGDLWQHAEFRHGLRVVTVVWGVVYLIEAVTRVFLAFTLTPAQVVAISPVMGIGATVLLIVFTSRYLGAMRRRREARMAAAGA